MAALRADIRAVRTRTLCRLVGMRTRIPTGTAALRADIRATHP